MTTESIKTRAVAALAALKDMLNPFKCTHPASSIGVLRGETIDRSDADFSIVTYHLFCRVCGEPVELSYAQMIGGVDGFLSRVFDGSKITPASSSQPPHADQWSEAERQEIEARKVAPLEFNRITPALTNPQTPAASPGAQP